MTLLAAARQRRALQLARRATLQALPLACQARAASTADEAAEGLLHRFVAPECPGVGHDTTETDASLRVARAAAPLPPPPPDHVTLRVHASGVNRLDLLQRRGQYPVPAGASPVLGVEAAGVVERSGCASLPVGTPVAALLDGGGYAERCTVPAAQCVRIESLQEQLTWAQAGALPEAFAAAYQLLHFVASIRPGESVLIHAGASGVGTAAVQLARGLGASRVVATASTADRRRLAEQLGATHTAPSRGLWRDEPRRELLDAVGARGADVILDCVGAAAAGANSRALARDGRWVVYGFMSGAARQAPVEQLIGPALLAKRGSVLFSTLRSRDASYKASLMARLWQHAEPRLRAGEYTAVVDSVHALDDVNEAHARLRDGSAAGKVVLATQASSGAEAQAAGARLVAAR